MLAKIWLSVFLGLFLNAEIAPASQWKEPAESEKKMVWYTTIGSADAKMLIDEFRRRYPKIAAEYFRTGGPQLVERIFTEARAGKHLWDVFMNSAIYTHLLIEKRHAGRLRVSRVPILPRRLQRSARHVDIDLHQLRGRWIQHQISR